MEIGSTKPVADTVTTSSSRESKVTSSVTSSSSSKSLPVETASCCPPPSSASDNESPLSNESSSSSSLAVDNTCATSVAKNRPQVALTLTVPSAMPVRSPRSSPLLVILALPVPSSTDQSIESVTSIGVAIPPRSKVAMAASAIVLPVSTAIRSAGISTLVRLSGVVRSCVSDWASDSAIKVTSPGS